MYGARCILEISGGVFCKVYDYLMTILFTGNEYKVILNVNYNWKIKLKTLTRECITSRPDL